MQRTWRTKHRDVFIKLYLRLVIVFHLWHVRLEAEDWSNLTSGKGIIFYNPLYNRNHHVWLTVIGLSIVG
jgi:hypothetical protein